MPRMHLMWFTSFRPNSWHGRDRFEGADWTQPEPWQELAVTLERACFDLILFADGLAIPNTYTGSHAPYLRTAEHAATQDPIPLLAMMAAATKRIGLAATLSTSFYPPFMLARVMATLDHLTRGRAAWNIVTSVEPLAAQNMGLQNLLGHDERYDQADEFIDLCNQLWDSWEPDAVVMDREREIFADPEKVHPINFEGRWYKSRGPLNVTRSPQGRPVIVQAGASERGKNYAAQHAEVVIVSKQTVEDMRIFRDDLKARVAKAGRNPDDCKIFFILNPVVAETNEAAEIEYERMYREASLEAGLADLSSGLQIDMAQFDLDQPLPPIEARKVSGIQSNIGRFYDGGRTPTLRQVAMMKGLDQSLPIVGSPKHVADTLEAVFDESGADGFSFRGGYRSRYRDELATQVVPILQERGVTRREYKHATLREHLHEW